MQVTIQFESAEEQEKFLASVEKYGFTTKEDIQNVLSEHLETALRYPLLRREKRKNSILQRKEALKNK